MQLKSSGILATRLLSGIIFRLITKPAAPKGVRFTRQKVDAFCKTGWKFQNRRAGKYQRDWIGKELKSDARGLGRVRDFFFKN